MVTTTTKTLNYSITKGNATNSVNATITSTPGFNSNYLGKIPGILKIVELLLAATALGLVASRRQENQPYITRDPDSTVSPVSTQHPLQTYNREQFLVGEVYFLCAHTAVLVFLVIILVTYLIHTTSAMIIPKATTLENVANILLALLLLAAGILEIVETTHWWWNDRELREVKVMDSEGYRFAAGAIALLNGLLFIGSFVLSRKELAGPKTL
jgi:hypothetical protein